MNDKSKQAAAEYSFRYLVTAVLVFLVLAVVVMWLGATWTPDVTGDDRKDVSVTDVKIENLDDLNQLDQATIIVLQEQAETAAMNAVGLPPITGVVSERPAYVSPVEWQVLKAVAAQSADSDESLTRLVYKLRFSKQWELWQSEDDGVRRAALAQQLLADIPQQVASNDLGRGDAQQLQGKILTQLYPDERQRRQRMAEEAERINVRFEIY